MFQKRQDGRWDKDESYRKEKLFSQSRAEERENESENILRKTYEKSCMIHVGKE